MASHTAKQSRVQELHSELAAEFVNQRREILINFVRDRLSILTFSDVKQLLESPHGNDLGSVILAEVATSARRRPRHGPWPRSLSQSLLDSITAELITAKQALGTQELAVRLTKHPVTVRQALIRLIDDGWVVTEGPETKLRYRIADPNGGGRVEPTAPPTPTVRSPPPASPDFDRHVLAQIGASTIALGQLVRQIGEPDHVVRAAVRRLEAAGAICRTGSGSQTRYSAAAGVSAEAKQPRHSRATKTIKPHR